MRNGTKAQNDAPFVAFYDMRAITFVMPDEMADVSSRDCSGSFLYPDYTTGCHRPIDSHSKPVLNNEKNMGFETRTTQPAAILRITRKADFSRLFRHAIEKARGPILYSKKTHRKPKGSLIKGIVTKEEGNVK